MNKKHPTKTSGPSEFAEPSDYSSLERNCHYLFLIDEACKGLDDVDAGKVIDAKLAIQGLRRHRNV